MSDDLFAVRLQPITGGGYQFVAAYEFDDGELEEEDDDFRKSFLTFSGDPQGSGFTMTAVELDDGGTETKVYVKVGAVSIGGVDYYLFTKQSEVKIGYEYSGTLDDDDVRGSARGEDSFYGSDGFDRFDCKGVYGRKSGIYYDKVAGGGDRDAYVIGGSQKSCYYDDNVNRRETFLYCDDFEFGDKFIFRKQLKITVRYELVDVSGSRYEAKLVSAGLVGVDKVLINKKDSRDMLACINFDDSSFPPSSGWSVSDVLG